MTQTQSVGTQDSEHGRARAPGPGLGRPAPGSCTSLQFPLPTCADISQRIAGGGGWCGGGCEPREGESLLTREGKIPRAHPQKNNSTRANGPNRSSPTCRDRLTEFQPDGVVTASHPRHLPSPIDRRPSRMAPRALLIAGLSFSPRRSSSLRLGCKPICIIDRPILGRASLALLNQTGCCRGLLRSAPRSLCMNSWTYGAPLSIVSACQLQSFTFDIGFALSLPVPPYNAPSSTPHDYGLWTTTNDERRGNPSQTTLATEQI